jgi:hypothetical protein
MLLACEHPDVAAASSQPRMISLLLSDGYGGASIDGITSRFAGIQHGSIIISNRPKSRAVDPKLVSGSAGRDPSTLLALLTFEGNQDNRIRE